MVDSQLPLGVRAIDTLLPCGRGQRLGIFAGSGVGKSSLLSMVARGTEADISVLALVGERGREVSEMIEHDLGPAGPGPLGGRGRHLGRARPHAPAGGARRRPGSPNGSGTAAATSCS